MWLRPWYWQDNAGLCAAHNSGGHVQDTSTPWSPDGSENVYWKRVLCVLGKFYCAGSNVH